MQVRHDFPDTYLSKLLMMEGRHHCKLLQALSFESCSFHLRDVKYILFLSKSSRVDTEETVKVIQLAQD